MIAIPLCEKKIRETLHAARFEHRLDIAREVTSTQLEFAARSLLDQPEGVVILAESQTGGRGRMERRFFSPPGNGIYMCLLLKPEWTPALVTFITVFAAVAVCRALDEVVQLTTGIKWVNDVFCNGKKICGILTEASISAERQRVDHVIVGIGLNTGLVAPEVAAIATSVAEQTNAPVDRNPLVAAILNHFEPLYQLIPDAAARQLILAEYAARQMLLNQRVRVDTFRTAYDALVLGLDADAALIVRTDAGEIIHLNSGEVSVKPV